MSVTRPTTALIPAAAERPGPSLPLPGGHRVDLHLVTDTDGLRSLRLRPTAGPHRRPLLQLVVDPGLDVAEVDRLLHVHEGHVVVAAADGPRLVGVGRFVPTGAGRDVELAVVVAPGYRDLGIERAILAALSPRARSVATGGPTADAAP